MISAVSPHGGEIFDRRLVGDSSSRSGLCGQCRSELGGKTTETVDTPGNVSYAVGREAVKNATATLLMIVLTMVTACAPAAPTPTRPPEPTATPAVVRATKPAHLTGLWLVPWDHPRGQLYVRFAGDGTMCEAHSQQELADCSDDCTRFWFEDGVYYEDFGGCQHIGAYRAYLDIKGGRAVGVAFEMVHDPDSVPACNRQWRMSYKFIRVD
jgi:hypothetical protein